MENSLPKGWVECNLADIADWGSGGTPKATENKYYSGGIIPWLVIGDLNDGYITNSEKKITKLGLENSSAKIVSKGAVLIAMYGSIGKLGITEIECTTNQAIAFSERIYGEISNKFLFYYLFSIKKYLLDIGKGGTQANISQTVLKNVRMPLPPLNEQQRIVRKLNIVLSKVNNSKARLERIPLLLKNMRQSILAAAVSGELTIKDKEWEKVTLEAIAERIQIGPFGTQLHKHEYISNGVPVINPSHIKNGRIVADLELTITSEKFMELGNYHLSQGDTIIGRRGEMGRCAIVTQKENRWLCGTGSLFIRPGKKIYPKFLFWILSSQSVKEYLENQALGTTMNNLNLSIIKTIEIPLPSIEEQKEIVRKLEELFAFADTIEARYEKAKAYFDKIPQAILAKAFKGELVKQDENDEPASELLKRIKQEKQATFKPKTKQPAKRYQMHEGGDEVSMVAEG